MPQGRGKQERLHRLIRERFLLEAEQVGIASLEELNDRFLAWTERYLNRRRHSETGESPLQRYQKVRAREADPVIFEQAFLWSARRRVSRTAHISFQGNDYQVDPALVGRWVDLRYRPEDLSQLAVLLDGRAFGFATPMVIERHVHAQVPAPPRSVEATGIDYLGQVLADQEAVEGGSISFRQLQKEDSDS